MASGLAMLGAVFAVVGGWIGPGLAVATALGLGRDPLARAVVGVAIGRLLFAFATLLATSAGVPQLLSVWAALGLAAGVFAIARSRRELAPIDRGLLGPLAIAAGAALLLTHAIAMRSGLDHGGALAFFGRDSANDPFVYGAYAIALRDLGPPLANPFAGATGSAGSYVWFAVLAGVSAIAATSMLDLVYRVLPFFEVFAAMATAVALVRALGAPRAAAWMAPLLLLAGDASPIANAIAQALGATVHPIDGFALFGPYLLAMNPISAGLQTLFAALLLLAGEPRRRDAIAAGVLVAALFEIKLFLWAPLVAGLGAALLVRPPAALRRPLAVAFGTALVASAPSALYRVAIATGDSTAFAACVGCLPSHLANAAWGDGDLSFARFRAGADLSPRGAFAALLAAVPIAAIALGARGLASSELLRGARAAVGSAPLRVLAFASAIGLALAFSVATPPHYLNASQFAWVAVFGLAPVLAIACARWLEAGRWLPLAAVALLAAPGSADAILRLGYGAPQRFAITPPTRALCAEIARVSAPGDVVFEPSMLADTDVPSPIPLLAGRPVYLSLLSAVGNLDENERDLRYARLVAFFAGADPDAARRALLESGARFVVVPARAPAPPFLPSDPIFENEAGRLYRAAPPPAERS